MLRLTVGAGLSRRMSLNLHRLSLAPTAATVATIANLVLLSGCYMAPTLDPLLQPQPVAQMGTAPMPVGTAPVPAQTGPIEVGCSYNATQFHGGGVGSVFQVACPPGCEQTGGLWGTDVYTGDSGICRAGIHAGVIPPTGGVVTVQTQPGRPAYRGSARYGIESSDYGQYGSSFQVFLPQGQAAAAAPPPPPPPPVAQPAAVPPQPVTVSSRVIEAGCSFNAVMIRAQVGTAHMVSCPPGCGAAGTTWGSDVYTGDSGICRAAIHSGIISPNGGSVVVILEEGRPAYRGSTRYGIKSNDYASYRLSFRLQRP